MTLEQLIKDERKEEKLETMQEVILELLGEKGEVSKELKERILVENNLGVLSAWHKLAAKSDSVEAFVERM